MYMLAARGGRYQTCPKADGAVLSGLSLVGGRDRTGWLGRQDSNLCISESEFANSNLCISRMEFSKTLSSGLEKSNMRISSKVVVPPLCQRKSQAMTNTIGSDSEMQRFDVRNLGEERPSRLLVGPPS
jgi:hypothetical protein